jgi:hypothetical protein
MPSITVNDFGEIHLDACISVAQNDTALTGSNAFPLHSRNLASPNPVNPPPSKFFLFHRKLCR